MKKLLGILVLGFLLNGCATPLATNTSITDIVALGTDKETLCKSRFFETVEFKAGWQHICHGRWEKNYQYIPQHKTEIIWNGETRVFFVYENVTTPMTCANMWCNYGDGTLKKIAFSMNQAQIYADPKLAKAEEERILKEKEEERKIAEKKKKEKKQKKEVEKKTTKKKTKKKAVEEAASGTAFFISNKGHIITNHHVVEACNNNSKAYYNGNEIDLKLIAQDAFLDLALLKAEVSNNNFITISNSPPKKLQRIIAAGYPFGKYLSDDMKFTSGIVSSLKGAKDDSTRLQIDAALNPGNSGGPIVDEKDGKLIAVAVAGLRKDMTEAVNFGIKASSVKNFLQSNQLNTSTFSKKYNREGIAKLLETSVLYTFCN